jgi:hypothetical protein
MSKDLNGIPSKQGYKYWIRNIEKPLAVGGVAALLHWFIASDSDTPISLLGWEFNQHVGVGLAVAGSAYIGEVAAVWVKPKLPRGWKSLEGAALDPILAGLFTLAAISQLTNASADSVTSQVEIFGIGFAASLVGDSVQKQIINPLIKALP